MQHYGRGLREDLIRRLEHYVSDWTGVFHPKILSSTLFIFFTSVAPSITFSLYISESTKNELGAIEILMATGITGCLMSIFAGQPLLIVGVTGPISILTASIYQLSQSFGVNFIPFYAWSQLWAALFHILLAIGNSCDLVYVVTRFSCETFGILIGMLYLYTGIEGIVKFLTDTNSQFAIALLQFILALGTVLVAQYFAHAKAWTIFNDTLRTLLSDYGATIAVLFFSAVPFMTTDRFGSDDGDHIPTLYVPTTFQTTSGRAWLVDFTDIPIWGIFAAIFPGLIITILFFFDHNVSSLIAQDKSMQLQKGTAFHWDFLILGFGVFITAILGLPPTNGLIPQAPLHVKSLVEKKRMHDSITGEPLHTLEIVKVHEQRYTNLFQSLLCILVAIPPISIALRQIPQAVLYGLFLFLGIASFEENDFANRLYLLLLLWEPSLRIQWMHKYYPTACQYIEQQKEEAITSSFFPFLMQFTVIQAICCGIIFGITFTPAGVIFPVLIALLILVRLWILPRLFSCEVLNCLDVYIVSNEEDNDSDSANDDNDIEEDDLQLVEIMHHHHTAIIQEEEREVSLDEEDR